MTRTEALRHIMWVDGLDKGPGQASFRKLLNAFATLGLSPVEWMEMLRVLVLTDADGNMYDDRLTPILARAKERAYQ